MTDHAERVHGQRIIPIMPPAFFWEFGDSYIASYGGSCRSPGRPSRPRHG
jgi:hypothetical protein